MSQASNAAPYPPFVLTVEGFVFKVWREDNPNGVLAAPTSISQQCIDLINISQRLSGQEILPPKISRGDIEIEFSEEGTCVLSYRLAVGSVVYQFSEADALIQALKSVLAVVAVRNRLQGRLQVRYPDLKEPL